MDEQASSGLEGQEMQDDVDYKVVEGGSGARRRSIEALPEFVSQRLLIYLLVALCLVSLGSFLYQKRVAADRAAFIEKQEGIIEEQMEQLIRMRARYSELQKEKKGLASEVQRAKKALAEEKKKNAQRIEELESELARVIGQ